MAHFTDKERFVVKFYFTNSLINTYMRNYLSLEA